MAKKSTTKYRLVFDSDFTPEWETFVLECRKRGQSVDQVLQTLVIKFNQGPPTGKAAPQASPLPGRQAEGSPSEEPEPEGSPEPEKPSPAKTAKAPATTVRKKKKVPPRPPRTPGFSGGSKGRGKVRPPGASKTKRRKVGRGRKPSRPKGGPKGLKGRGAPSPGLPPLDPGPGSILGTPSPQETGLTPLPGGGEVGADRAPPQPANIVQLPTHLTPKFQLLELLRQLDVEGQGVGRDELLNQALANAITNPELTLNKLIRRGLVHIYEGRCRTV